MMFDQRPAIVAGAFQQLADEPVGNTFRPGKITPWFSRPHPSREMVEKNFHPPLELMRLP
jgi:hypothetical protein